MKTPTTHFNKAPLMATAHDATVEPETDPEAHTRSQIAALNKLIDASNDPADQAELREKIGSICMSWYIGKLLAEKEAEDNLADSSPVPREHGGRSVRRLRSLTLMQEGSIVLKRDVRGRVRTPSEQREAMVGEFERSGLPGTQFAKLVGMKYSTLMAWVVGRSRFTMCWGLQLVRGRSVLAKSVAVGAARIIGRSAVVSTQAGSGASRCPHTPLIPTA